MSRHVVRSDGFYEVVVGWDPPLRTFFAQVFDREATAEALKADKDADEVMVVWTGVAPHEISNFPDLQRAVQEYAVIDMHTREALLADKALNR
jgi:hypothetical protein